MGSDTLVDLVAKIWSLGSATINAVKSVASNPLGAIKAMGTYILNTVLGPIVEGFADMFTSFMKASGTVMQVMNDDYTNINLLSNGLVIGGQTIKIYGENLNVVIEFNNRKISISSIYLVPFGKSETLSMGSDSANNVAMSNILGFVLALVGAIAIAQVNRNPSSTASIIGSIGTTIFALTVVHLITNSINALSFGPQDKSDYFETLKSFYAHAATGFLMSIMLDKWINPVGAKQGVIVGLIETILGISIIAGEYTDLNLMAFFLGTIYTGISTGLGAIMANTVVPQAAMATNIMLGIYSIIAYLLLSLMENW